MLNRIHAKGVRAGVALKPATSLSMVEYVLEKCDTVLLMLINPGYAFSKGEKQVSYASRKIRELRAMIEHMGTDTKIELDGRISLDNLREFGRGDADIFVTGSTILRKEDLRRSIKDLQSFRKQLVN
jgi:ribulose-phosphate 3-epimerase